MKNNEIMHKKKNLLWIYICACWIFSNGYNLFLLFSVKETFIQSLVIILSFIVTTVFYYIFKNRILRLIVMISAIAGITLVIGYECMLTVFAAFAVIYIYKSLETEEYKNEIIDEILLILAPFASIAGLIINFRATIKHINETVTILTILETIFLILMICAHEKKSKKKGEKSEHKMESMRKAVLGISIIGVLSSTVFYSFTQNIAIAFFPWFLFIVLMIYEDDKSLHTASEKIVNKIKAFTE